MLEVTEDTLLESNELLSERLLAAVLLGCSPGSVGGVEDRDDESDARPTDEDAIQLDSSFGNPLPPPPPQADKMNTDINTNNNKFFMTATILKQIG